MAYAMTKQGSLDNCITYEFICDTIADMNAIENRYRTLGSIAVVLSGESEGLEVYIAGSDKAWNNLGSMGAGNGDSAAAGLSIYICTQGEYDTTTKVPTVEDPDDTSLYLVPASQESGNLYDEYVYVNNAWEKFGGGSVNLSNYATLSDISGFYTKPNTGIPASDIASGVIPDTSIYAPKASPEFTGSISLGRKLNTTIGYNSVACGMNVIASSSGAHAEGSDTAASGADSHAEGSHSIASGTDSHAEGNSSTASGANSHAEGQNSRASGIDSHAEGQYTIATGMAQHVSGRCNIEDDYYNWPEWTTQTEYKKGDKVKRSTITNELTIMTGYICKADHTSGNSFSSSNWDRDTYKNYAVIVGNGTIENPSNAYTLDWEGNETIAGSLKLDGNIINGSIANNATGLYAQAHGTQGNTASGDYSVAIGCMTNTASGDYSYAHGNNGCNATGDYSYARGIYTNNATGNYSIAIGCYGNYSNGNHSFAQGNSSNTALGNFSLARGQYSNMAIGKYSIAIGESNNIASGEHAVAIGKYGNIAGGDHSIAIGEGLVSPGKYQCSLGKYNAYQTAPSWTASTSYVQDDIVIQDNKLYTCITANSDAEFTASKWKHIPHHLVTIGNGAGNARSNAYALDQEGNGHFSGNVYVNCNSNSTGGSQVATINDIPDISGKANKTDTILETTLSRGRKANTNVGPGSFAFGSDVEAMGPYTHAEGYYTQAQGIRAAHAEGVYTFSSAEASHAEGYGTSATASGSHAEGYGADSGIISNNIKRNGPSAVGPGAHAEGYGDAAGAPYASDKGAHAEGYKTLAVSQYTHAEGEGSLAGGQAAHAEGQNTKATNNASHAEGIGDDYSNNGKTVSPGSFGIASHAEGYQTFSANQGSHAEGYRTQAIANYAHSEGNSTTASGGSAHAEGEYTKALSLGAHAEGYNTTANAIYAHAEGYGSSAIRDGAHAEGSYTHADGTYSHAEGTNSIAKGHSAHAEGYNTIASAAYSHVVGCYNIEDNLASWPEWEPSVEYNIGDKVKRAVIVDSATVIVGYSCRTAHASATFIQSNWNIVTQKEYVEIVGNGTANNARSNARALDWEGNERLMGDLYIGCNADSTGGTAVGARIAALEAEIASLRAALEAILNPTSPDDTIPEDAVVMEDNEPLTDEQGNVLVYDTPST